MMDKPRAKCMPSPSASCTDRSKTPSERTMKCCEQRAKQRAKSKECKTTSHASSSTGVTSQPKVSPTKQLPLKSTTHTKTEQTLMPSPQAPLA
uniref:Uncharacterized protein n=1 Tax=Romanomermis culicivorax TaxID=13658 RepID=A0A915I6F0_ROMCU